MPSAATADRVPNYQLGTFFDKIGKIAFYESPFIY